MTDTGMCHQYRTVFPFQALPRDSWEYSWGAPGEDIWDYDVVVGQRIAGYSDLWRELGRKFRGLLVYDLDDDLIDVDPLNTVPYQIYQPMRLDTIANIQAADVVTVSTPYLAAKIRRHHPEVVVLPNRLPRSWIRPQPRADATVGWSGSPFHQQDFPPETVQQILAVRQAFPQVRFRTIGGHFIPGAQLVPYQPLETAMDQFNFTVGLAPLRDCEFNWSKSWCKAFEYAARGVPVVASEVGQYREWISNYGGGLLVPRGGSFTEAIGKLLDPDVNAQLSEEALQAALMNVMENHSHAWHTVYNGEW
jgi:hypothetical protein